MLEPKIAPLRGLVLAGGRGLRMGQDKGSLIYARENQRTRCHDLLRGVCRSVHISCRQEQRFLLENGQAVILDAYPDQGPAGGLLSAHRFMPEAAWLVLACDLPLVTPESIEFLVERRDPGKKATVYAAADEGRPEPLFGVWEPSALDRLEEEAKTGNLSPARTLEKLDCLRLAPLDPGILANANTPTEFEEIRHRIRIKAGGASGIRTRE